METKNQTEMSNPDLWLYYFALLLCHILFMALTAIIAQGFHWLQIVWFCGAMFCLYAMSKTEVTERK